MIQCHSRRSNVNRNSYIDVVSRDDNLMQNLFEEDKKYIDNLKYIDDKKKYWINYFNARLAESNDPLKQKKILEKLKEYV